MNEEAKRHRAIKVCKALYKGGDCVCEKTGHFCDSIAKLPGFTSKAVSDSELAARELSRISHRSDTA